MRIAHINGINLGESETSYWFGGTTQSNDWHISLGLIRLPQSVARGYADSHYIIAVRAIIGTYGPHHQPPLRQIICCCAITLSRQSIRYWNTTAIAEKVLQDLRFEWDFWISQALSPQDYPSQIFSADHALIVIWDVQRFMTAYHR